VFLTKLEADKLTWLLKSVSDNFVGSFTFFSLLKLWKRKMKKSLIWKQRLKSWKKPPLTLIIWHRSLKRLEKMFSKLVVSTALICCCLFLPENPGAIVAV